MRLLNSLFLVGLIGFSITVNAQRQSFFVAPIATDPQISTNLSNHFIAIDPALAQKDRLFIFLPGTTGIPLVYRQITNNAAEAGFHSIALTYPNDDAVNVLCGGLQTDLDCYSKVRLEIIDGTDRSTLVAVNRSNSIENRLIKLLLFLDATRPAENWDRFLNQESAIDWTKIVIAGHSQGGGHAGIIGRYHPVSRVLMFAASDYNGMLQVPANWIAHPETTPNASPADRFWGFSHQLDESVNFTNLTNKVWPAYGMPAFGPVTNVDGGTAPYGNTHSLTSSRACDNHHGCIAVDFRLVIENGVPVYKPVWDYLLTNAENTVTIGGVEFLRLGEIAARPAVGMTTKRFRIRLRGTGFDINSRVVVNGQDVFVTVVSENLIEAMMPAGKFGGFGLSTLKVTGSDGNESNVIRF